MARRLCAGRIGRCSVNPETQPTIVEYLLLVALVGIVVFMVFVLMAGTVR